MFVEAVWRHLSERVTRLKYKQSLEDCNMPPKKGSAGGKSKQEKGDDGSSGSGKEKKAGNAVKVII